jgi:hypothetical protein
MNTTIQRNAADTAILRELAARALSDSIFSLNTNDTTGAAKRLQDGARYLERMQAMAPAIVGNASQPHDDFAGYDCNNPHGEKQAPLTGNAGQAGDEFANYDINAL